MAQREVIILNEVSVPPALQVPQAGDTYLLPRDVEIAGNLVVSGTVDGVDVAVAGALALSSTQPGDNLSTLVNDILASQGEAEAGAENTKIMTPLRVAQAIAVLAAGIKNNYTAVTNPATTNDDTEGYVPGSVWINTATGEAYRCVDNTTNLAVWVNTTLTALELATVALSGDSDDLTEGAVKLLLTAAERAKLAFLTVTAGIDLDAVAASLVSLQAWEDEAFTVDTGIAAFAGGGQASATQLTDTYNQVTTVASVGDSVKLPPASMVKRCHVFNRGASTLALFPSTGDNIEDTGADASVNVASNSFASLVAIDDTNWYYV